jgi:hypothetical protein
MVLIIWTLLGLVLLFFWLTGHWFAWLVMGVILALTVQLWCPVMGLEPVAPASSDLFFRATVTFFGAGIPFYFRTYLRNGLGDSRTLLGRPNQ